MHIVLVRKRSECTAGRTWQDFVVPTSRLGSFDRGLDSSHYFCPLEASDKVKCDNQSLQMWPDVVCCRVKTQRFPLPGAPGIEQ